jgi:hypothetical protein
MPSAVCKTRKADQRPSFFAWLVLIVAVMLLAQCGQRRDNRILFEGEFFRAKASKLDKDDRQSFIVQIGDIERSFEGALQAGAYEATKYCIENYGTSDIQWISGPEDDPDNFAIERGRLTLQGTCVF